MGHSLLLIQSAMGACNFAIHHETIKHIFQAIRHSETLGATIYVVHCEILSYIVLNDSASRKMVIKCVSFFPIFLKVLELFEGHGGD